MSSTTIDLVRDVAADHFGPIVAMIAVKLLKRGRTRLDQLCKETTLTRTQAKQALTILIHHNIVTFALATERGREVAYYEASLQQLLLRDRFARYVMMVYDEYDQDHANVVQTILVNGRLHADDIAALANIGRDSTRSIVDNLVDAKLIVAVTSADQNTVTDKRMGEEEVEVAKVASTGPLTALELKKLKTRMTAQRAAVDTNALGSAKRKNEGNGNSRDDKRVKTDGDESFFTVFLPS